MRLRADITTDGAGTTLPTIQDWRISLGVEAAVEPTAKELGPAIPVADELPISVWGQSLTPPTGDGVNTTFQIEPTHLPMYPGYETIYVNGGPVTDYTINYQTGVVELGSAPKNGGSVTADYLYWA